MSVFQSTRPRGARPDTERMLSEFHGFNPRARGGRDKHCGQNTASFLRVSIHAPAGGATVTRRAHEYRYIVSIHAPAGGATVINRQYFRSDVRFNPRARGGRDNRLVHQQWLVFCFNPRARGGRDTFAHAYRARIHCFNPRARGGRDSVHFLHFLHSGSFNPRARGGRDLRCSKYLAT